MEFGSIANSNTINTISPVYRKIIPMQVDNNTESGKTENSKADAAGDPGVRYKKNSDEFSPAEKKELEQLKKADASVRSHELAHVSAGGRFVRGGAKFQYQTGPDGNRYAVAGEVGIDSSPIPGDPKATAEKMDKIRAAALAPSDPSNQDRRVANMANRIKAEALMELSLLRAGKKMDYEKEKPESLFAEATMSYNKSNDDKRIGSSIDLVM